MQLNPLCNTPGSWTSVRLRTMAQNGKWEQNITNFGGILTLALQKSKQFYKVIIVFPLPKLIKFTFKLIIFIDTFHTPK